MAGFGLYSVTQRKPFGDLGCGVKEPGQIIGQMVWEGRYDCSVKEFGEEERGVKRLLK